MSLLHIGAVKKLQQDFQDDISGVPMCQLCKAHSNEGDELTKFEFFQFNLGDDTEEMLNQFHVMMEQVKPDLICKLWDTAVEDQVKKMSPDLTFKEVHKHVWRPVYQACEDTIEKLSTLRLPLRSVKEYFFPYSSKIKLEEELKKLCNAINMCRKSNSQTCIQSSWIRDAMTRIFDYKQLCQYGGAAGTFLKLRDTLGLTGDFAVVEVLSKAVSLNLE